MNLIDYNQAIEALEKERQSLLSREQYEAENILVEHAINVISELPIIRQPKIVRCKDCRFFLNYCHRFETERPLSDPNWYCADGERK